MASALSPDGALCALENSDGTREEHEPPHPWQPGSRAGAWLRSIWVALFVSQTWEEW